MAEQSSDRQSHAVSSLLNEAIRLLGASGSEATDRSPRNTIVLDSIAHLL